MTKLPHRLLLNAEPFGFGPTAAIAGLFPHLRAHFSKIGFMGKRHTLDLQRNLPYDAIHDITDVPKLKRWEAVRAILPGYDILLTAMDHKVADEAERAGMKVMYYDALAWYWPSIPESVQKSDLYLAQDFFGVKERLAQVFARHANAHIVPPIIPLCANETKREHVLINLGGLQNPYWPVEDVVDYARSVISALKKVIPENEKIIISASEAVSKELGELGVKTYPREEMEDILARSKASFMTPGLGNIYDAAAHNIPTIWLPPANDSQGQQLMLLEEHGMNDGMLNWSELVEGGDINYRHNQPEVLAKIAELASSLTKDENMQARLSGAAAAKYALIAREQDSKTTAIIDMFGRGGEEAIAERVVRAASEYKLPAVHYG